MPSGRKSILNALIGITLVLVMISATVSQVAGAQIVDLTIARDLSSKRRIQCVFEVSVDRYAQDGTYMIYVYDVKDSGSKLVGQSAGRLSQGILSGDGAYWIVDNRVLVTLSGHGDHSIVAKLSVSIAGTTITANSAALRVFWS